MSYMDQLDFGVVACRELIPDAWKIADGLGAALDELKKRAEPEPPKKQNKSKRQAKVVLVHGAWHGPWCWQGVVDALEAQGVDVHAVELPADELRRRRRHRAEGDQGRGQGRGRVRALVRRDGHLTRGQWVARRPRRVPHRVHDRRGRAADGPHAGASLADDGRDPRRRRVLTVDPAMLHEAFYEDSDPDVVVEIEKLLRPMPLGDVWVLDVEPAWRQVPSTYIVCTNDKAISEGAQRAMAGRRRRGGGVGHRPLTVPHSARRHRGPSGQARVTGGRGGDPIALRRASSTRSRR